MLHWTSDDLQILRLSVTVAALATLAALGPAIAVATLLARRRFWGHAAVNALVHLPLVLPPVVTGYFLLRAFGTRGPIGGWLADTLGLVFAFRWTAAASTAPVQRNAKTSPSVSASQPPIGPRVPKARSRK